MNKIYKLLIESPEFPKGSFAVFKDEYLGRTSYMNRHGKWCKYRG